MACCSSLTKALGKLVKKLAPLLAVALLAFGAYIMLVAPAGATLGAVTAGIPWLPAAITSSGMAASTAAMLAVGAAVVISPGTVSSLASGAVKSVSKVAGSVISAGVSGLASGLFGGNFWLAALGGLTLYLLLSGPDDDKEEKPELPSSTNQSDEGVGIEFENRTYYEEVPYASQPL